MKVGDEVEIVGFRDTQKTVVTGVEMFRKLLDQGERRQHAASSSAASRRTTSSAARSCCKPGSVTPHKKFRARCTC